MIGEAIFAGIAYARRPAVMSTDTWRRGGLAVLGPEEGRQVRSGGWEEARWGVIIVPRSGRRCAGPRRDEARSTEAAQGRHEHPGSIEEKIVDECELPAVRRPPRPLSTLEYR